MFLFYIISSNFLHIFIKRGPINRIHMTCFCNSRLKIIRQSRCPPGWRSRCVCWGSPSGWRRRCLPDVPPAKDQGNFPLHDSESQVIQTYPPSTERVHPPKMERGGYWDLKGHVEKKQVPFSPQDTHSDDSAPETVLHLKIYYCIYQAPPRAFSIHELNINCAFYPH